MAAPVFDAVTTLESGFTGPYTISHTVANVANRHLHVQCHADRAGAPALTSVTYAGVNLTFIQAIDAGSGRQEVWAMVAPATGANNVVVTSPNDNQKWAIHILSYNGVDQTTPRGTVATAWGGSDTVTVDVTAATGDLVVDCACQDATATETAGAGQTQRAQTNTGIPGTFESEKAGAATVTMSWTRTGASTWQTIAFALKQAGDTLFAQASL